MRVFLSALMWLSITFSAMAATLAPPSDGSHSTVTISGRTYTSTPGVAITVPEFDVPALRSNGWTDAITDDVIYLKDPVTGAFKPALSGLMPRTGSDVTVDAVSDSRMADMFAAASCNNDPLVQCGLSGTNFLVQAQAQSNYAFQIGVNKASSGCRSDQYLYPSNIASILNSGNAWLIFGYPFVNDLNAGGAACAIQPGGGAFPFTNANGVLVHLSNVALVAATNITTVADQAIAAGKRVIISLEPGNTATNTNAQTVANFTGTIATGAPNAVLTVTAVASGTVYQNQTISGSGVTAGTIIMGTAAYNSNLCTPACTGSGGTGTYALGTSQTLAAPTSITATYTNLAALYEFNGYLLAYAATKPGRVFVYDPRSALWSPTGSSTAIVFKPGIMVDSGTHYGWLGGWLGGTALLAQVPALTQNVPNVGIASINYLSPGNPFSLINNPLFNGTQTGGTLTTCNPATGNATPPTGWQVTCAQVTTTTNMSVAADANGYGNALTITFTSTVADTATIRNNSPAGTIRNLNDWFSGGAVVAVAAGSSHCTVFGENQINSTTPSQTRSSFTMFPGGTVSGGGTNDGPTTAYTVNLRTPPAQHITGTTQTGFLSFRINVALSAAGSCTVTVSRPFVDRVKVYNPLTKTFSGWLLQRDLDPASNDNAPASLLKAG